MNQHVTIWGREFDLPVVYSQYEGEEVLPEQDAALAAFLKAAPAADDSTLERVKSYCLRRDGDLIPESTIGNIFKYVMPRMLYLPRSTKARVVSVMCYYKPDMEANMAVVFENESLKEIGPEFIIL